MLVTLATHLGLTTVAKYYSDIVSMVGANAVLIQGITIGNAGSGAANFLVQGSCDKETWVPAATTPTAKSFSSSLGGEAHETWGPLGWPYIRVQIDSTTAGLVVAVVANTFST